MDNPSLLSIFKATNGQNQQRTTLYDAAGNVVAFGSGGTSTQDEATFTPGTSLGVPVMGVMDDTAPDGLTEGQQGIIRATPTRGLHVTLYDAAGNEVTPGAGTQYVTGTASAGPTGTVALGWDGANVRAVKTDANGELQVDVLSSALPTGASTAARQDTGNTSLATLAGAVAGTEVQVDVLTSGLPTGAATESTLSAVSADADDIRLGIGATADAAATAGSTGSVNAKLRLATSQLDSIKTATETLDNAVETNRFATNPIAGQVGVQGGAGASTALTQRVAIATDANAVDTELPAAAALADAVANPTVTSIATFLSLFNGTTWDRLRGSTTGVQAIGGLAHDDANTAANKPSVQGFETIAYGTNPTAVAAGDVTKGYANRAGVPFTLGGHPNIVTLEAAYTAAQTDTAFLTIGAGAKAVVTQIQVVCDSDNTVKVAIRVGFGTANTPTTTGVLLTHPGMVPGSGVSRGDGSGILGVGADNEDIRVTATVPTGGSVRVLVSYFTVES